MAGNHRRTGAIFCIAGAVAIAGSFLFQRSALMRWEKSIEHVLDSTQKTVRLLSRTSVVENGLHFGASEVIQALFNRTVLGEDPVQGFWAQSADGKSHITNTYSSTGLYVGSSVTPDTHGIFGSWLFATVGDGKTALFLSVPVEHEEDLVGHLGVQVNVAKLLPPSAALGPVGAVSSFGISRRLKGVQPTVFLHLPPAVWLPPTFAWIGFALIFALALSRIWNWSDRMRQSGEAARDALYRLALQVAHDIRGPVGALWGIRPRLEKLRPEDRELFHSALCRIDHIGEQLLEKYRVGQFGSSVCWIGHSVTKAIRECAAFPMKIVSGQGEWGACVRAHPQDLQRVLSILLRNAMEAAQTAAPTVHVGWRCIDDKIRLFVRHNGSLKFKKLVSHGLGTAFLNTLPYAYSAPRVLQIAGQEWVEVSIELGRYSGAVKSPDAIAIPKDAVVIVLDDDPDVHRWFEKRLSGSGISLRSASDAVSFRQAVDALLGAPAVYFIDFRLAPGQLTGPEVASQQCVGGFLLTSTPEDPGALEAAARWQMLVIPKTLLPEFPFQITNTPSGGHAILIDDDALTRESWSLSAAESHVRLDLFCSPEVFLSQKRVFPAGTCLYLDGGLTSHSILARLRESGVHEIYLTTGDFSSAGAFAPQVKGILDKRPPWGSFCFQSKASVS